MFQNEVRMIEKEELIKRISHIEGESNKKDFKNELVNIFEGMKEVAQGFLKIAKAKVKMSKITQEKLLV